MLLTDTYLQYFFHPRAMDIALIQGDLHEEYDSSSSSSDDEGHNHHHGPSGYHSAGPAYVGTPTNARSAGLGVHLRAAMDVPVSRIEARMARRFVKRTRKDARRQDKRDRKQRRREPWQLIVTYVPPQHSPYAPSTPAQAYASATPAQAYAAPPVPPPNLQSPNFPTPDSPQAK